MARIQLLVFEVGNREFAIDAESANGILRAKKFTIQKLPGNDQRIDGMINLRGKIIYLFNLCSKLDIPHREISPESKIVLVQVAEGSVGFIVDEVNDIVRFDSDEIEPAPFFVSAKDAQYIRGVGKIDERLLVILKLDHLLSVEELESLPESV